jgi:MYXO-CTERM domain-containing protein
LLDVTPAGWVGTGDLAVQGYAGSVPSGDGKQWFDLNPGTAAGTGLSQDLSLMGGTTYELSFVYNGGGGGSTTQIDVSIADASHAFLSASVDTAAMNVYGGTPWATYSASFTPAADTTATLKFTPNGTWSGGFIDAVSVSAVPEPPSRWMTLAGVLGVGAATVRRRRGQARASGMAGLDRHRQI